MRITDLLQPSGIDLNAKVNSKEEAIDRLIGLMEAEGNLSDVATYKKCVLKREEKGTTGIGEGVAIPHAKTPAVKKAGLSAMVAPDGVDFDSMDGEPTRLFFLIAAPDTTENVHLDVLGRLSVLLMDDSFRRSLIHAKSKEEFLRLIDAADRAKEAEETKAEPKRKEGFRILAVTACPTGIAHTYMAAEAIENKAKEMGLSVKVETNGSGGRKNILTQEEIEAADGVIVAADTKVPMSRFDGKPVIQTQVSEGISHPGRLLQDILDGRAPVYHAGGGEREEAGKEKEGVGHQIYKHLMNGVSHMLPFVIGGGILIALAFLFDTIFAPEGDPANFGMNSPVAAFLKSAGGVAFNFMLPVLAGFIAMSIADRPGLMVGFVAGAIANAGLTLNNAPDALQNGGFFVNASSSGFLGALLAGFIAGYVMLGLKKLLSRLPKSLEGTKPILFYPVFGLLIVSAIIIFIVNPPVSALNTWISNALMNMGQVSGVLLGLLVAGMMAVDMGGPFNKAAYVFGTASLLTATGAAVSSGVMASVMIGGMVPPIAIALCTTFFKNRFTEKERQTTITNYIMGLSFITEGAIPFAAADPLRVIPSCVVGSAVAGGLSMLFGCTLPAPHGGIFVFPVIHNWPMYLLSLAIGSVISMALLAVLKKPIREKA